MTLFEELEALSDNKEALTTLLITLDTWLEYLHNHGKYIYDFDPKKIILENGKLTFNSFQYVTNGMGDMKDYENAIRINIFQDCKIGLMAYNNIPPDGNMNQEHFDFLQTNLQEFNKNGMIPEDIYEYYEEVFRRLNVCYMNDYLVKKEQEKNSNQNVVSIRKVKATNIGIALNDENAYVKVLFIPTLIAFTYLFGLFIYIFILK